MPAGGRRWLKWGLQVALSVGLMGFAAYQARFSWHSLAEEVTGWQALLGAILLAAGQIAIYGLRWWLLLPSGTMGPWAAVLATFRASGINQLVPVSVAGEVWRYRIGTQNACEGRTIAGSLMLDRAANIAAWGSALSLVLLLSPRPPPAPGWVGWSVVGISLVLFLTLDRGTFRLSAFTPSVGRRLGTVLLSILAQGMLWMQFVACFAALGIHPPSSLLLLGFPWLLAAKAIPLAFAGWGIREVAVLQIYQELNCEPQELFTASVLLGATSMVVSVLGLIPGLFPSPSMVGAAGAYLRSDP